MIILLSTRRLHLRGLVPISYTYAFLLVVEGKKNNIFSVCAVGSA